MYRGFYLAANGLINQQRVLDTTSNNMANSMTAGFKSDMNVPNTFAREMLLINNKKSETGTIEYRTTDTIHTPLKAGTYNFTGSRLDVALTGDVYFNIEPTSAMYAAEDEAADNTLLTRNGQFNIDDEGYLALGSAGRILSEDGPIQIGTADFAIDETGLITTTEGDTFQLALTYIENTGDIIKKGDNMFIRNTKNDGDEPPEEGIPDGAEFAVLQGAYERSNVNVAEEMTKAMEAQRAFEACSAAIKMIDKINISAATELSRLS